MPGEKTNERPGTRAVLKYCHISAYKVRPVLDLIRGKEVGEARDILRFSERDAAIVVAKLVDSAVANASHNDDLDPEELYVSACFADEGMTHKRWRPRARGRATRIRKRTSHITVIVSRLPEDRLQRLRAKRQAEVGNRRARRVAGGRAGRRQRRDEQLPGTTEPVSAEAAETVNESVNDTTESTAEEAGIVDQQDAAIEAVEESGGAEEAPVSAEPGDSAAEEAGIVDQQDAALEQVEKEEGE